MPINQKEFFSKDVLEVKYTKLQPFIGNTHIKNSLNFLNSNYNISEGTKLSLKNLKQIFLDLIEKFKGNTREDYDDKYKQKGWNKFYNKLKKVFHKLWNRAFSIVCSVTASAVVFTLGFAFLQSLMWAIVACSIYTIITFSIKYFAGNENGTNMLYEPEYVGIPKLNSIVNFIKFMYKFMRDTIGKVLDFFFYKIEEEDSKNIIIRRRRLALGGLIVIIVLCLILI